MAHAGRPTKYSPKILKQTEEYLAVCEINRELPQIAGLALALEVDKTTIYEWGKEHPHFSHYLAKLMSRQEVTLFKKGLLGEYNAAITKLMLTKHGYRDSQDVTSDGKPLPTPILGGITKDE